MVRQTEPLSKGSGGIMVWGILLVFASVGLVLVMLMFRGGGRHSMIGGSGSNEIKSMNLFNFTYRQPKSPWESDIDTREALTINIVAMQRFSKGQDQDADVWFAIAAQDFKDREPRDRELREGLMKRLRAFENVESEEIADAKWSGQPAFAYRFKGEVGNVLMSGSCYSMRYKGIAYWFFGWTLDQNGTTHDEELTDLRERVKFMSDREKWTEKKINTKVFTAEGAKYSITDTDGLWKKQQLENPTEFDPAATIALYAEPENKDKDTRRQRTNQARLHVLVIDGGTDPLKAAKAYIQDYLGKQLEGTGAKLSINDIDTPLPDGSGVPETDVVRFRSEIDIDRDRRLLHVISTIKVDDKIVVAWAECEDRVRQYWEPYLVRFVGSLKAGAVTP